MRPSIFGLVGLAALAAGCSSNDSANNAENAGANVANPQAVLLPRYTIVPGPVTGSHAAGINGSFRVTQVTAPTSGPNSGIPSNLEGGACIVFRAQDLGYTQMAAKVCTRSEDCDTGEGAGYCEVSTRKCWARPAAFPDPLCRRSIDAGAPPQWDAGIDNAIPASGSSPAPAALKPNAQALIIACLKSKGEHKGCGRAPDLIKWGSPASIP
jgi:hypothetical protein